VAHEYSAALSHDGQAVETMNLVEHIEAVKGELAACQDVDEAARLYRECREAMGQMMQLVDIAGDVADKLTMRTIPETWIPFVIARGSRRMQ
jgi:hypothetical protein